MASAEQLKTTHSVDNRVRGIDDRLQDIANDIKCISNKVQGVDDKLDQVNSSSSP